MESKVLMIFGIGLAAIMSPGPDFLLIFKSALRGRAHALRTVLGIMVGVTVQNALCVLGLSLILHRSPMLFGVLKYLGAAYLIYLGAKCLWQWFHADPSAEQGVVSGGDPFLNGLLCNLLNPKFTLFLLSLFSQVTDLDTPLAERAVYGATLWIQSAVYWTGLALVMGSRRAYQRISRIATYADPVLGVLLLLLGIRVSMT